MFVPLLALDTVVLAVWWASLAAITLPIWYCAPWQTIHGVRYHGSQLGYFPNGPHGPGGWGLYVDMLPKALAVTGVCLVLFLLFNYVLVLTARAHAAVPRGCSARRKTRCARRRTYSAVQARSLRTPADDSPRP